jgi:hypothetical protein
MHHSLANMSIKKVLFFSFLYVLLRYLSIFSSWSYVLVFYNLQISHDLTVSAVSDVTAGLGSEFRGMTSYPRCFNTDLKIWHVKKVACCK